MAPPASPRRADPHTLIFKILRGRQLRAADSNGFSDPYVVLKVGDAPLWRSQRVSKTLNPDWNALAVFAGVSLRHTPYAIAEVWDSDVTSTDDPLGKCVLPIAQLLLACADGSECELMLGRRSPKGAGACGSLWVHLAAAREGGPSHGLVPPTPPSCGLLPLATAAELFSELCACADSRPSGLGSPAAAELLECRLDGVVADFLGRARSGTLYVSNARLFFVPALEETNRAGGTGGADVMAAAACTEATAGVTLLPFASGGGWAGGAPYSGSTTSSGGLPLAPTASTDAADAVDADAVAAAVASAARFSAAAAAAALPTTPRRTTSTTTTTRRAVAVAVG